MGLEHLRGRHRLSIRRREDQRRVRRDLLERGNTPRDQRIDRREHEYIGRFAGLVEQALPAEAAADEVRYTTHALIGMTSWIYKWFDPARDDRDEIARRMIRLVVSGDVDVEAALASASQGGRPAPDPAAKL